MLLATRSAGKLRELRPLFESRGIRVLDLDEANVAPDPEEDAVEAFTTFEENAAAKARYFFMRTGLATVADDSGLAVDALGGAPGVLSKRWSGRTDLHGQALDDENNRMLQRALGDVANRRARYVCAAAYQDEQWMIVERGEVMGAITDLPRGDEGFGYDPYFLADELGCTFGEASREVKEAVSHRGRAFRLLLEQLARLATAQ